MNTILCSTGLPVAYYEFPQDDPENPPPELPFICYLETGARPFGADGIVYYSARQMQIELYSELKDPALEERLETVLDAHGIYWEKTSVYLSSENCWETIYISEV